MLNSNQENLIFPENTPSIISDILKKYQLETLEKPEEILEKFKKGEQTAGEIIAELIKKAAQKKLSPQKLSAHLKAKLNISSQKAEYVSKDIEEKILSLVEKREVSPPEPEKHKEPLEFGEESRSPKKDIYREPIE